MTSQSGDTNLTETTDNTLTIPTLASGSYTSPSDFPANHWGYKKDSGSYIPFATNTTILESDTYANDDTTTLSFATKIDYLQASGTYKTTLVFTTTANPLVTYIQNLDSSLCTEDPLTVVDNRDEQEYVVQRLKDGNCWMMTNLNLGAVELSKDLTSENTNLTTTVTAATFNSWRQTAPTQTYVQGVYTTITNSNSGTGSDTDPVSGTKYGTLYNFCALTAGDSRACMSSTSGYSPFYDLCPAGWKIPALDEFSTLYGQYNTFAKMRASVSNNGAAFTLNGWFGESSSGVSGQSTYGSFWSSTPSGTSGRGNYYLRLDTYDGGPHVYATPSGSNVWYANNGRAIRCIAK